MTAVLSFDHRTAKRVVSNWESMISTLINAASSFRQPKCGFVLSVPLNPLSRGLGLQPQDVFLISENETTKPVPLRLVHPVRANRKAFHSPSLHRGYRRNQKFVERLLEVTTPNENLLYFGVTNTRGTSSFIKSAARVRSLDSFLNA